jgi:hypothetical protein
LRLTAVGPRLYANLPCDPAKDFSPKDFSPVILLATLPLSYGFRPKRNQT